MATLKRARPNSPAPAVTPPTATVIPIIERRAVRRVLGQKAFLPATIKLPEDADRTDYRKVVGRYAAKVKNPKTAIRAKCIECSGGSLKEVAECLVTKCALHPFRTGENPFHLKTIKRKEAEAAADGDDGDEAA